MASRHEDQCSVCRYGVENINWGLSNVAVSQLVDCSEGSVRRHKAWAVANGFAFSQPFTVLSDDERPEWVETSGVPRRAWQTPSGEWRQSFQNVPGNAEIEALLDNERIDSLIVAIPDPVFPDVTEGPTELFDIADPQLGKSGEALGGTDGTIARIYSAVKTAIETRYLLNPPKELYLIDGGDIIENLFSTPQQFTSNDRTLPEQVEDAISVYMNVIGMLLPYVGSLTHVTVTSNHGEARTAPKVNPYGSDNDWGFMIQRMIRDRCVDRGWDVTFIRPDPNEDTAVFTTGDGTKIAVTHGHHSSSPSRVKDWIKGQDHGRRPGWDADLWLTHHFHHSWHDTLGGGRWVFGTPSVDPGSSWFTRKTGDSSPPAIMCLTVNNGKWSNHSIVS